MIYTKANREEAVAIQFILTEYYSNTGQEINWDKSTVHFNRNTNRDVKRDVSTILGIQEYKCNGKYLGHPFCQFKSKAVAYKDTIERMANKLSGWRKKTLSVARRLVLIKSVAQKVSSFIMQTVGLSKSMLRKIDSMLRNFL